MKKNFDVVPLPIPIILEGDPLMLDIICSKVRSGITLI